ncbi:MAG TPA: DUF1549 and DUF1553 domain-containing protein, partial [Pirellulaceae bacterium]|nr:DUF1549 and DUF1553 domain-containing protein [Pirellulaceae bacterium]
PTAEQLEEFASDPAPDAYQRQVDRLLASPHFGERWGRYWLDLARFAETCGYERDQEKPQAWRYRDWVVRMLNADLPYDRFALEQIAGDELPQRGEDQVVATGFLRVGTWNDEPNDAQEYKYERLEDMVNVTMTSFLGLTVKCARCHDHKFDPVPQADYYRVANAFWAGPIEPRGRELLGGPTKDELGFDVLGWTDLTASPPPLRMLKKGDPTRPGEAVAPGQLTLFASLARPVAPPPDGAKTTQRRRQLAEWIVDPANPLTPRVAVNRLWLHHFGQGLVRSVNNFGFQGERPTHPQLLDWLASELVRREWRLKSLHRELVSSSVYRQSSLHPRHVEFTERDFANSLWWRAERRRLDAESLRDALLAASGQLDLRMGGPSFKPTISADALEGLSRKSGAWQASPRREQQRRSLYTYSQRSLLSPLMTVFDFADTTLPCGQRDVSTVAPQALALLNNEFAHQQSEMLARRVIGSNGDGGVSRNSTAAGAAPTPPETPGAQTTPDETARRVRLAWRLALGRDPSAAEVAAAVRHVDRQRSHFQAKLAGDGEKNASAAKGSPALKDNAPNNATNNAVTKNSAASAAASEFAKNPALSRSLALHLDPRRGVTADAAGKLQRWADLSERGRHATQDDVARRPELVESTGTADGKARPAIRFDGQRRFLALAGPVVASQQFTVIAVVNDRGPPGHRELISNWNGAAGNSVTSAFVGLTGESAVRLSDDLSGVGQIVERGKAFLLTAVAGAQDAVVLQNERVVAKKGGPLSPRNL